MKVKAICLLTVSIFAIAACNQVSPNPEYGSDYNTPEFFLARLNPASTRIRVYGLKGEIEDSDLSIRDALFSYYDYNQFQKRQPTTKNYFSYYTLLENSDSMVRYAEMFVYTDGYIIIDYKELLYKKTSFYHVMDSVEATNFYTMIRNKIEKAMN